MAVLDSPSFFVSKLPIFYTRFGGAKPLMGVKDLGLSNKKTMTYSKKKKGGKKC